MGTPSCRLWWTPSLQGTGPTGTPEQEGGMGPGGGPLSAEAQRRQAETRGLSPSTGR